MNHNSPSMRAAVGASLNDSIFGRLLDERIIFLEGEVKDENSNRIIAQLLLLEADDPDKDIKFYINSPGGSVTAGMGVFDTMQLIKPDVVTVGIGMAASMGQFLLTAGAKGKRFALPHTRILMHQPSAGVGGTAADIAIQAEMLVKHKQELTQLNADHTGQSYDKILEDSDRDRWFTAREGLEYGFVDHILSSNTQLPA